MDAILADTEGMVAALAPGPVLDALNGVRAQAVALRDVMLAPATTPWTPEGDDAFEAATAAFQSACG